MPIVKIFARRGMTKTIPLTTLQTQLCEIWGVTPKVTKCMLFECDDWTDESFKEDVYVDIRAKGTEQRTREVVLEGMKQVQAAFLEQGLIANVRLETYEEARYFHLPPGDPSK